MAGEEEGTAGDAGSEEGKEEGKEEEEKGPPNIEEALARAREALADKGTMMAMVDEEKEEDADGEEKAGDDEDEEKEEGEEEGSGAGADDEEDEEDEGSDADDESDEVGEEEEEEEEEKEGEEEEKEEKEEEEAKPITVKVPGREVDDEDIEIEVDDQELADRINHLKNGFMHGVDFRKRSLELDASESAMEELSDAFEIDPAGFVMQWVEEKDLPQVVLALLTQKPVWDALAETVDKLFGDAGELRTLQAESKAARLEAKSSLEKRSTQRKADATRSRELSEAIDLMVPESMAEKAREQLVMDLTRDTTDHISRNKLGEFAVKDLVPLLAARLETNGIDPLDARKAIQNGSRSRGKISTKKGPKKKPKTGQELAKASAKRKKVAAAPGPGKKAAPAQPTKLPAGQTIQERIASVRKHGLTALLPEK